MMNDKQIAKQRRGAVVTALLVGGLALMFYVLFVALRW